MSRAVPVHAEGLHPGLWRTRVTIRFGDCDPAGIVYTPVYFHIFQNAVEEWHINGLGLDYYAIVGERKVGLGYAHASGDFFRPSFMGDELSVAVALDRIGRASFALTVHAMKDGHEAARGRLVVVTTSLTEHKAIPIPADIRAALAAYRDRCG
jgi:4-hydroxybenzoyl-CoA thioesterase/acyl-CoA thioester hydrolase